MKFGILGGGNMGEAFLSSALRKKVFEPENVVVVEENSKKKLRIADQYKVATTSDIEKLKSRDAIMLAVKPQDFDKIKFPRLQGKMVISIMAGKTVEIGRASCRERV